VLPAAAIVRPVLAEQTGFVTSVATREIGLAVIGLGGGRTRPQDGIDHAVGFSELVRPGDAVGPDRPLGLVHARDANAADVAAAALRAAYRIGADAPGTTEAIHARIG
jgi:thymidine phosphorylase